MSNVKTYVHATRFVSLGVIERGLVEDRGKSAFHIPRSGAIWEVSKLYVHG